MTDTTNTSTNGKFIFGRNAWLIAYDIAEPRRLGRVHRLLKTVAMPIQYSVFIAWLGDRELHWLVDQLRARIDLREDDVRLYHLPVEAELVTLGEQWLPDGVQLFREGQPLRFESVMNKEDVACRRD